MADTDQHNPNDELPVGSQPGPPGGGAGAGYHDEAASGKEFHENDAVPAEGHRPVYHFDLTSETVVHSSDVIHSAMEPLHRDGRNYGAEISEFFDHPTEEPIYQFYLAPAAVAPPPEFGSTEAEASIHVEPAGDVIREEPQEAAAPAEMQFEAEPKEVEAEAPLAASSAEPAALPVVLTKEPPKARSKAGFFILITFLSVFILLGIYLAAYMNQKKALAPEEEAAAQQASELTESRDLGTVDSKAAGLKGHLITKWNEGLKYNFVIEPDDPARLAAFESTVSNPPRRASFTVQIKNANGFVLCSREILLKFDPRMAAEIEQASAERAAGRRHGARAATEFGEERRTELDRQAALEAEREQGKGIFQINRDSNGRIGSISSQGEIPCPQQAYEGMGYWSFLPDFPSPDEQDAWANLKAKAGVKDDTGVEVNTEGAPAQKSEAHQRIPNIETAAPGTFSTSGDDAIVAYDASAGHIETRSGKIFSIDKGGADARAIQAYDLPVSIHYTCNESAACTLTHGGAVMAHAQLSR